MVKPIVLRQIEDHLEDDWTFNVPNIPRPYTSDKGHFYGLHISFLPDKITLDLEQYPSNRVLQTDDPKLYVLASFGSLRFKDHPPSDNINYIKRFLKKGLVLNERKFWFYGHSNSQLRGRSCFLREGVDEGELHARILALGEFGSIKSVSKLSKRIGLLFSSATVDWNLDPKYTRDIPDLEEEETLFSDGCGLISLYLARLIAKEKKIIFRQQRYTPCVFQIRYRGYKGVLMVHPELDKKKDGYVHFRKSMKKFSVPNNNTFSVVEYSNPYTHTRLNNDIVTLLSALGISNEVLEKKLRSYLDWLTEVKTDLSAALDFLSSVGSHDLVNDVLLKGLDSPGVQRSINSALKKEIASFKKNETDKDKLRLLVPQSRYVFGVCDPFQVLEEGEVFIRITMPRDGPRTIHSCPVMVVRNPCLHPGDCLKLRAVDKPELRHLVDCVVFASKGKHAAPSLSSGGDLDGDQYTVIWDKELVPPKVAEHFMYPAVKERKKDPITRQDLAAHFAGYNSISMGQAASLHSRWVRCRPEGAMSKECQELNALYSQCVDGARIRIPDRLRTPPEPSEPFIVDTLLGLAKDFAQKWLANDSVSTTKVHKDTGDQIVTSLLNSDRVSMSEFQVLQLAWKIAKDSSLDIAEYYALMNFSALTTSEKHLVCDMFKLDDKEGRMVWNSLMRSDLISPKVFQRDLQDPPLRLQRLYTTTRQGLSGFFEYLRRSLEQFKRRFIILKTDDRFSAGIFIRGPVQWDEESVVNENVVVFSLTPTAKDSMSLYKPTSNGYRLHCSDGLFQLYNKQTTNTWIFINRPPMQSSNELQTSIALQMISASTQKHLGRINKTPIVGVEIHVVSNQDRVAQQIFDLRFDRVPTEEKLRSIVQAEPYVRNSLKRVDFSEPGMDGYSTVFTRSRGDVDEYLETLDFNSLNQLMEFALQYHEEERAFWIFQSMLAHDDLDATAIGGWLLRYPHLVFRLLHLTLNESQVQIPAPFDTIRQPVIDAVVFSANEASVPSLVALEKLRFDIAELTFEQYCSILWSAAMVVRGRQTAQEILIVLDEQRRRMETRPSEHYAHRQALQIAFERAEEAFESCPCDEQGRPTRQRVPPVRAMIHPRKPKKAPVGKEQGEEDGTPQQEEQTDVSTPSLKLPVVVADIRVDKPSSARLHSHVRLTAASKPEKQTLLWRREILDGIVKVSFRGEVEIELFQYPPPEYANMEWNMYDCGSTATTKAMMDALKRLHKEQHEACSFHRIISGSSQDYITEQEPISIDTDGPEWSDFNDSQKLAIVESCQSELSLIWGPPGTGKTTVVVKILELLLGFIDSESQILMTASTHNAVDNVLERFARKNATNGWVADDALVRAATDANKVGEAVKKYTVDALIGGSPTDDPKLIKKAEKRIKEAKIIFTTCAGAGLGVLRNIDFETVLIDEASQITEGVALIPLAKGSKRAILVGDHVQLRPTVKRMSTVLESDVSLFERLYTGADHIGLSRSMLNVQYRFAEELARFPSVKFYEGRLGTGTDTSTLQAKLSATDFPWPKDDSDNKHVPNVFVPCSAVEDMGGQSKQNEGQAKLVAHIVKLLSTPRTATFKPALTIAILTPYTKQKKCLERLIPSGASIHTVDGFQGREADFVVYSSVRCNPSLDIGFLMDERRLNVAWTRARVARIVVGDIDTLKYGKARHADDEEDNSRPTENSLWKDAIEDCRMVKIVLPEE